MRSVSQLRKNRNPFLETCKLCAAFLVVFHHYPFPRGIGQGIYTLTLGSVPFFFSISGYFSYGTNRKTVAKRMTYLLKLILTASLIYSLSNCFFAQYAGVPVTEYIHWDNIIPTVPGCLKWLILHWNPFSEHLWYLTAMCFCYFYLWVYLGFFEEKTTNYSYLYLAGLFPLFALIFFGCIAPYAGFTIPYVALRNGWIYGPALFLTGMFIHEYEAFLVQAFKITNRKLLVTFLAGVLLALAAWKIKAPGDIPLGTLIQVPALLLLCVRNPNFLSFRGKRNTLEPPAWQQKLTQRIGSLYTALYILHMAVGRAYETFLQPFVDDRFGELAPWMHPILILLLSLAVSFGWEPIEKGIIRKTWIRR